MSIHAPANFFFYRLNTREWTGLGVEELVFLNTGGMDEVYVIHAGEFLGFDVSFDGFER